MKKIIITLSFLTAFSAFASLNIKEEVIKVGECTKTSNVVHLSITYKKYFLEVQAAEVHETKIPGIAYFRERQIIGFDEEVKTASGIKTLKFGATDTKTAEEVCSESKENLESAINIT